MIRIGIFGEHFDNDAQALKALLGKRFYDKKKVIFIPIIKNLRGGQLDQTKKLKRLLKVEVKNEKLNYVIAMRDLDGLPSEIEKIRLKQNWYQKLEMGKSGIFFLVIFEAEALILADIETFNKKYGTRIPFSGDPLMMESPKTFFERQTAKSAKSYEEAHALDIFGKLNFEKIYTNHTGPISFKTFVDTLNAIINPK